MQIWPGYSNALSPSVAPSSETIPWPRPVLSFPVASLFPLPAVSSHAHFLPWESEIQLRCHLCLYPSMIHETKQVTSLLWTTGLLCSCVRDFMQVFPNFSHHSCAFFFFFTFSPYHINWYFISIFKTWSHLYLTTLIWKGNSGSPPLMASLSHP